MCSRSELNKEVKLKNLCKASQRSQQGLESPKFILNALRHETDTPLLEISLC